MAINNLFLTLFVKIKVAFANVQRIVIKKELLYDKISCYRNNNVKQNTIKRYKKLYIKGFEWNQLLKRAGRNILGTVCDLSILHRKF